MMQFNMYFHFILFALLVAINMVKEIADARKVFFKNEEHSDGKEKYYTGEKFMMKIIIFVIIVFLEFFALYVVKKNLTAAFWFYSAVGIAYMYIAVRQIVKMLCVPEKRPFTNSDIRNFTTTYSGWWLIVFVMSIIKTEDGVIEQILPVYGQEVKVWIMFLWYFLNIMFVSGGVYIVLCSLLEFLKKVVSKFDFRVEKIRFIVSGEYELWQRGEKYDGLKSYRLWKEHSNRKVVYKIFMTMPLLLCDTCNITCLFVKYYVWTLVLLVISLIWDPISLLYKGVKNLWNRYENNEWMHLLAQIAGVVSYLYVFLIIQYGKYEEVTKNIYEFFGTIFLLQYFTGKIANMNKKVERMGATMEGNIRKNIG